MVKSSCVLNGCCPDLLYGKLSAQGLIKGIHVPYLSESLGSSRKRCLVLRMTGCHSCASQFTYQNSHRSWLGKQVQQLSRKKVPLHLSESLGRSRKRCLVLRMTGTVPVSLQRGLIRSVGFIKAPHLSH
jgi:hypothetical protein